MSLFVSVIISEWSDMTETNHLRELISNVLALSVRCVTLYRGTPWCSHCWVVPM